MVLSKELGFSVDRTSALVNEFDVNKDGRLSYDEFVGFYSKVKQKFVSVCVNIVSRSGSDCLQQE